MLGKIRSIAPRFGAGTAVLLFAATSAHAELKISTQPTRNMSCSGGVCTATAQQAVLNVTDLQNILASSSVKVATGTVAKDIFVNASLNWASANALTLDAYRAITIDKKVSITGTGGLTIFTNDGGKGGMLSFGEKGNVTFWSLSSSLTIDGASYTLASDIATLARDIANNRRGNFALANDYDAGKDGTYSASPIRFRFRGSFEGLGHVISNLKIDDAGDRDVGLFSIIHHGFVRDLGLVNANVAARASFTYVGALVGSIEGSSRRSFVSGSYSTGTVASPSSTAGSSVGGLIGIGGNGGDGDLVDHSYSTANVSAGLNSFAGGLAGWGGSIHDSYATGTVTAKNGSYVGGLVGTSSASVSNSFATGAVTTGDSNGGEPPPSAGGLVGYFGGTISNSYALGSVVGGQYSDDGGLVGYGSGGTIYASYSTGQVSPGGSNVGGLLGTAASSMSNSYWDMTTSGITNPNQGCGDVIYCIGVTGLTDAELKSSLPPGFDPKNWSENANTNGGLPYLLSNPPPS